MLNYSSVTTENLGHYIDAKFPILYICTFDEVTADKYIESVARRWKKVEWNGADGFVDFKTKTTLQAFPSLEDTLTFLKSGKNLNEHLLVIKDAAEQLEDKRVVALLKEIARKIRKEDGGIKATVIIVSSKLHIPQDLEKLITVLELGFPDEVKINEIIQKFKNDNPGIVISPGFQAELSRAFKGLYEFEIESLLVFAASDGGELTDKDLHLIFEQKKQMILKAGVLEMVELKEDVKDIGGLENLKDWLDKKASVFKNMEAAEKFGVPKPKGVLIAGIPGCGKSLTAKAAGKMFNVPLLKLDMGRLMGRYVGESEENMRKAIQLAEAISPCVLWIDELEKAFAGIGGGGSEVTTRLFGTFLTWMQDKRSPVFVVATANDISNLPPELLRKGRFDEIFYVDLPNPDERKKILEIHIKKCRKDDVGNIEIDDLIKLTEGYSGADIESVVGESVESVFVKGNSSLTTEDISECIKATKSLSKTMPEKIAELQKLYKEKDFKKASR
jgi:SpoVK/Ycf46/Vps4 family AAA+-type ATPase